MVIIGQIFFKMKLILLLMSVFGSVTDEEFISFSIYGISTKHSYNLFCVCD